MDGAPQHTPEEIRAALNRLLEDLPALIRQFDLKVLWLPGGRDEFHQRIRLEALKSLGQFTVDGELVSSLRRWLTGIARIEYLTMAREAQRAAHQIGDDILHDAAGEGLTPLLILAREAAFASIAECLAKLNDSERRLILQVCVEKRPQADVAREHGLSADQLYRRVKHLRHQIRDCWGSTGAYRFVAGGG